MSLTRKLNAKTLYKYLLIESNSILKIIRNDPLEFIAGLQGWFIIRQICQWNSPYINRLEKKLFDISDEAFDKVLYP